MQSNNFARSLSKSFSLVVQLTAPADQCQREKTSISEECFLQTSSRPFWPSPSWLLAVKEPHFRAPNHSQKNQQQNQVVQSSMISRLCSLGPFLHRWAWCQLLWHGHLGCMQEVVERVCSMRMQLMVFLQSNHFFLSYRQRLCIVFFGGCLDPAGELGQPDLGMQLTDEGWLQFKHMVELNVCIWWTQLHTQEFENWTLNDSSVSYFFSSSSRGNSSQTLLAVSRALSA